MKDINSKEVQEFLAEARAERDAIYERNKETLLNSKDFRELVDIMEYLAEDLGDYLERYENPVAEEDIIGSCKRILEIFHEDFSSKLEEFEKDFTEEDYRWQRKQ